ncbi:GDSL-type esterase/lipase family protein [Methylobacterium oxalidis]|uniref:GDSL-type esterase/lipase family protein n=1 Tax=Methylobacterium oxalidis TaxID=944322 RepID=UPI003314FD67
MQRTVSASTACSYTVFGDPLVGVNKTCELLDGVQADTWQTCASEGQTCTVSAATVVRYGAGDRWYQRTVSAPFSCVYTLFGDPAFGVNKTCQIRTATTYTASGTGTGSGGGTGSGTTGGSGTGGATGTGTSGGTGSGGTGTGSGAGTGGTTATLPNGNWVGTWRGALSSPALSGWGLSGNYTLRMSVRVSAGSSFIRVRLGNELAPANWAPMRVGAVRVGRPNGDPLTVDPTKSVQAKFGGAAGVAIPPGGGAVSDPIALVVPAGSDLVVSVYVVSGSPPNVHDLGKQTGLFAQGDQSNAAVIRNAGQTTTRLLVSGIDALADPDAATIVAVGDSITDGAALAVNGNERWTDVLTKRLIAAGLSSKLSVVNAGISGNGVVGQITGPPLMARMERDVFAVPNAKYAVLLEGVNDINFGQSPAAVLAGYEKFVAAAQQKGIKAFLGTLTPCAPQCSNVIGSQQALNAWVRASTAHDGFIDFEKAMQSPANPARFQAAYDTRDGLHPSAAGASAMANTIDISIFNTGQSANAKVNALAASQTWRTCANEGQTCKVDGTQTVRYGANRSYMTKTVTGSILCSVTVFGNPYDGTTKSCQVLATSTSAGGTGDGTGTAGGTGTGGAGNGSSAGGTSPGETPPSGELALINRMSGKCVQVPDGKAGDGLGLNQITCTDAPEQNWTFLAEGAKGYRIRNTATGACLWVQGGQAGNGPRLVQMGCATPGDGGYWQIRKFDQWYELVAMHSGRCASVNGQQLEARYNGNVLVQYDCNSSDNRRFTLSARALPSAWTPLKKIGAVAVTMATLPNGKLMMFQTNREQQGGGTYTSIYDPATDTTTNKYVANTNHEMFCVGTNYLPDGRLMISGGNGYNSVSIYDAATDTWSRGPSLNIARGYQGTTTLSNGDSFTYGGSWVNGSGNKAGEVLSKDTGKWRINSGIPGNAAAGPGGGPTTSITGCSPSAAAGSSMRDRLRRCTGSIRPATARSSPPVYAATICSPSTATP